MLSIVQVYLSILTYFIYIYSTVKQKKKRLIIVLVIF